MFYHAVVLKQNFRITLVTSTLSVRPLFNNFGTTSTSRGLVIENPLLEKSLFRCLFKIFSTKRKLQLKEKKEKKTFLILFEEVFSGF